MGSGWLKRKGFVLVYDLKVVMGVVLLVGGVVGDVVVEGVCVGVFLVWFIYRG